ncbi:hypothetical protein [Phytohabitans kaempferiae]|uniref:Uncharacterized protein n=1 Tax=Phytohabitans kaempferiae TaxID=1620943 RepID=A0ABV6M124_9ACTN
MGYDLHISRALFWSYGKRYPIMEREFADLIEREPDLWFEPDRKGTRPAFVGEGGDDRIAGLPVPLGLRHFGWHSGTEGADGGESEWLHVSNGQIQSTWPGEALIRRMAALARSLDAWLMGDDCELYVAAPDGTVTARERTPDDLHPALGVHPRRFLTRHARPIPVAEWWALVAGQPDFRVDERIEALLPSGWRLITCPPVAHWTGHPSGRPVPFFHEGDGYVEVAHVDPVTRSRMVELAALLDAGVHDD